METQQLADCLDEYIAIELLASKIYRKFSWYFPGARSFWWRLSMEELNHASLLRSAKDFLRVGRMPEAIIPLELNELQAIARRMEALFEQVSSQAPTLDEACEMALGMEDAVAERHLQGLMSSDQSHPLIGLMVRLNSADFNHSERIREFRQQIPPG